MSKTNVILWSSLLLGACMGGQPADGKRVLEVSSAGAECDDPAELCLETYPPQCTTYCASDVGNDGDCAMSPDGELVCGDRSCIELSARDGAEVIACAGPDCAVHYDAESETETIHCGAGNGDCPNPEPGGGCSVPGSPDGGGSSGSCGAGGVPWNGEPVSCDHLVGNCCYDSVEDACAAAGCAPERCVILESYPAQVSCEPDDCPDGGDGTPECPFPA